jgi:hypothetical protein
MRPVDWEPLAQTDPLPGDPDAISAESTRLARLGDDMRTQAARLRQIGANTTEIGAHADSLRSASNELAQDLDKAAGRYERVASALKDWAPELASAQAQTLQARTKAIAAEELRLQNTPLFLDPRWGQSTPADALLDPVAAPRLAAQNEAEQMLAEAQRTLRDALEQAESRGRHYANLIDDANHILKDSNWANFKDWVDRNADWLDESSKWLGYVATAAAIGAIFIPGANIVALGYLATVLTTTAMVATGVAAAEHLTLVSTGNGSWVDVGFDVLALATLGVGLYAARSLEGAQEAVRIAASGEARHTASEAILRSGRADIELADRVASRSGSEAARQYAMGLRATVQTEARVAGSQAARALIEAPLPATSLGQRVVVGDRGLASTFDDVMTLAARFPASSAVTDAADQAANAYHLAQNSYVAATAGDLIGKTVDSPPWAFQQVRSAW